MNHLAAEIQSAEPDFLRQPAAASRLAALFLGSWQVAYALVAPF